MYIFIYIYINIYIIIVFNIYLYIFMCVCVCVYSVTLLLSVVFEAALSGSSTCTGPLNVMVKEVAFKRQRAAQETPIREYTPGTSRLLQEDRYLSRRPRASCRRCTTEIIV